MDTEFDIDFKAAAREAFSLAHGKAEVKFDLDCAKAREIKNFDARRTAMMAARNAFALAMRRAEWERERSLAGVNGEKYRVPYPV